MKLQLVTPSSSPRVTVTWNDLLDAADTTDDVIRVCREFLRRWEPAEIAALPEACRPPLRFFEPEDVVNYAFELVQHHCGLGAGDDHVFRMVKFFQPAAQRIAILMSAQGVQSASNE